MVPQYSQKSIERALRKLRDQEKIEVVGQGRSTKYKLSL
ncbi:hypothetical protein PECL_1540 [Pediococcus claussenii ATCC BAA-344]|uniref:Uncharacterized protein n=1 Tax=Pediococcus claussenii (strain ATCC BAA-344 / DSM 14800 / JCM 18046 / KCTC 3811 / LMG 21948 / P06) TaxID=701521 RepID=G8PAG9_PEDCP|nr:hypothetical protein PECL_1540 [Pediococcus claussenii ATCC BAA-344]